MRYLFIFAAMLIASQENAVANAENSYVQHNLVANKTQFKADKTDPKLINAWGIAIRPAGAGGHFWVTGGNISFQYVGDVQKSDDVKLRQLSVDDLPYIDLPVGGKEAFATSVTFNGSKNNFVITQTPPKGENITAPAKFIFASDGGIISAWTERKKPDGTFDWPLSATTVIDLSADGSQIFGITTDEQYNNLYAADFGKNPKIRVFDGRFKPKDIIFDNPFDTNKNGVVDAGEYAPFNIQTIKLPNLVDRLFVAFAKTKACPDNEIAAGTCKKGEIFAGEEDTSQAGMGRLAEYNNDGKLINIWDDKKSLSAPWGIAVAPDNFGALSGHLLVANFGDGTIAAFDPKNRSFVDHIRDGAGKIIKIDGIWGLLFGNGASLGDKDSLYFTAGPNEEKDGIFGRLKYQVTGSR